MIKITLLAVQGKLASVRDTIKDQPLPIIRKVIASLNLAMQ